MKPKPRTIEMELKRLRKIVETSKDPMEARVAYTVEHAIRWATEETAGWTRPSADVPDAAKLIKLGL